VGDGVGVGVGAGLGLGVGVGVGEGDGVGVGDVALATVSTRSLLLAPFATAAPLTTSPAAPPAIEYVRWSAL
jgi:hypothetical protein